MLQLVENCRNHGEKTLLQNRGAGISYNTLLNESEYLAKHILEGKEDLAEARVTFLVEPGFDYLKVLLGIWRAGGIAVPLSLSHPVDALQYTITDSEASILITSKKYIAVSEKLKHSKLRLFSTQTGNITTGSLPDIGPNRRAMILYTSGTTGNPKGVVTTHQNIESQIKSLIEAWQWESNDHILNVLPLHHVHGIINATCCALWSGASITFLPKFSEVAIFDEFENGNFSLFMAVPTIYYKLLAYYNELDQERKTTLKDKMSRFRLMVSGSAALPVSVMEKWKQISGQILLERYGMTEIGMAISNPYMGERIPGHIGQALPEVQIRVVNEEGVPVTDQAGEIQVKGPTVFKEYWKRPKETIESFSKDGWFKTGDIAELDSNSYKILGRKSVDIIKSGGYKLSALEIEEVLRTHPSIADCAVVGIPDEEWGEVVGACLVLKEPFDTFNKLNEWGKKYLPSYKIPKRYLVVDDLPKNSMGKVTKVNIKDMFVNSNDSITL